MLWPAFAPWMVPIRYLPAPRWIGIVLLLALSLLAGLRSAAGTQLDTSALYTTGEISITAVPEPGQWALLLAGLAGLTWRARRQRTGRDSA